MACMEPASAVGAWSTDRDTSTGMAQASVQLNSVQIYFSWRGGPSDHIIATVCQRIARHGILVQLKLEAAASGELTAVD